MATQAVAKKDAREEAALAVEKVIVHNDLSKVSPEDRVRYYIQTCEAAGFDPRMQPFMFLYTNGKMSLYATRNATDQARKKLGINLEIVSREYLTDAQAYVVTARATTKDGRVDESIGAVQMAPGLRGEQYANAIMKAETKAKRRVTLSISGLSMLDETEFDTMPGARVVNIDMETGEEISEGSRKQGVEGQTKAAGSNPAPPLPTAVTDARERLAAAKAEPAAAPEPGPQPAADREPPFGFDANGNFVDEETGEIGAVKDVTPPEAELPDDLPPEAEPAPQPEAPAPERLTSEEFIGRLGPLLESYGKNYQWFANYTGVPKTRSDFVRWYDEGDGARIADPLAWLEEALKNDGAPSF